MMNNTPIDQIYNETFSGCTFFYRDTSLTSDLIDRYKLSQILLERGFTDLSSKGGGLSSNLRYLVASSRGKNLSALNPNSGEAGHILIAANAYYKVLDIYKIENKTQILLLHISKNSIELFRNSKSNIEEEIIGKARKLFETQIDTPAVKGLQSKEWVERTKLPLGMNDQGEFFRQGPMASSFRRDVNNDKSPNKDKPWWKIW